jgi:plastocyanin
VTVPAFAIDMDIQPGQRVDVKIPAVSQAPRDGFFTFYCKYHQAEGEAGRINVSR